MQQTMRVFLLLYFQYPLHTLIDVVCTFNLKFSLDGTIQFRNYHSTHRCCQVKHCPSSYQSLFVIILDLHVDYMDRFIEVPTSSQ